MWRMKSPTRRTSVTLPPMPSESEAARMIEPIAMVRSRLEGSELVFEECDGFERALREGFFLLRIPHNTNLASGDCFVQHFFKPAVTGKLALYTGFKSRKIPGAYQGYFDRDHDQWENFYIERENWRVLPPEVSELGGVMAGIGIKILRAVLRRLGIPEQEWPLITSGLSEGHGHQMLAFNHFRSDKGTRGSKFHRDSGWVTVLRSTEPGLLAYIDGQLRAINPSTGHFIVNFGSSIAPCVRLVVASEFS